MKNFKLEVINHLKKQGYNCIVQNGFPDFIAWKPFTDINGNSLQVTAFQEINGQEFIKVMTPFYIAFIICKPDKKLNKKDKENAKIVLAEKSCDSVFIAFKKEKKLSFEEIDAKPLQLNKDKKVPPFYLG